VTPAPKEEKSAPYPHPLGDEPHEKEATYEDEVEKRNLE